MSKLILMTAVATIVGLPLATTVKAEEAVIKRDGPVVDHTTVIKRDVDRPAVVAPPVEEKKVIIHRD